MPAIHLEPFDRSAVDLLVRLEGREILSNRPAEALKALTQTLEPSPKRIVDLRLRDVSEAICAPVADGTEAAKASATEPECHALQPGGTNRAEAAPCHRAAIDRRRRAEDRFADRRPDAVG